MRGPDLQGVRRAALWLHDLPADVSREVLKRLAKTERAQLEPLLGELKGMGIVPQRERTFDSPTVRESTPDATETPTPTAQALAARLDGRVVAQCLESCADGLLTRWLQSATWPWKEAVLGRLAEDRRVLVFEGLHATQVPLAPAALEVLCARLCDCAESLCVDDDDAQRQQDRRAAGWRDRLLAWLKWSMAWKR